LGRQQENIPRCLRCFGRDKLCHDRHCANAASGLGMGFSYVHYNMGKCDDGPSFRVSVFDYYFGASLFRSFSKLGVYQAPSVSWSYI